MQWSQTGSGHHPMLVLKFLHDAILRLHPSGGFRLRRPGRHRYDAKVEGITAVAFGLQWLLHELGGAAAFVWKLGAQDGNHVWQPAMKSGPPFHFDPKSYGQNGLGDCRADNRWCLCCFFLGERISAVVMHSHRRETCLQICLSLKCQLQETNTSGGDNVTTLAKS